MSEYLRLRSTVLALLEKARTQKLVDRIDQVTVLTTICRLLRSSLEAEVDLVIPTQENHLDLKGQG